MSKKEKLQAAEIVKACESFLAAQDALNSHQGRILDDLWENDEWDGEKWRNEHNRDPLEESLSQHLRKTTLEHWRAVLKGAKLIGLGGYQDTSMPAHLGRVAEAKRVRAAAKGWKGKPTKADPASIVLAYRRRHPTATAEEAIRNTGLSRATYYRAIASFGLAPRSRHGATFRLEENRDSTNS